MDKADIFLSRFYPPTKAFFWGGDWLGGGPENPKIQAGKELFHCYNWVGSCEEH